MLSYFKIYAKRDILKQVDFFIRCSKLKESAKVCKFLSSGVILKSTNNTTFSYNVSKCAERLLDKLFRNMDLLWSGGLYAPTINHFLKQRFISRKRVSLSFFCQFSCFRGMFPLIKMYRPLPKLSLSCLNILYPAKRN